MISLCTVVVNDIKGYIPFLEKAIDKYTNQISEVFIANVSTPYEEEKKWVINGVKYNLFSIELIDRFHSSVQYGHATGLHAGLNKATNEYVFFTDPDVFFCEVIDDLYLEVMEKYNLDVVGVSHHGGHNQCYTYFPCLMNMMIKRDKLPPKDFLKGHLHYSWPTHLDQDLERRKLDFEFDWSSVIYENNGNFFIQGAIPEFMDQFPNPGGVFDAGCNLYIFAQQENWRWLSFQTMDCHWYDTLHYKTNFKLRERLYNKKRILLYHQVSSTSAIEHSALYGIKLVEEDGVHVDFHKEFKRIYGK